MQSPNVKSLQQLLRALDESRATRDKLEAQLKEANVNIPFGSMNCADTVQIGGEAEASGAILAAGPAVDKDTVAVQLLGKLDPLVQEVSNAISRTNDLVSQIKVCKSMLLLFLFYIVQQTANQGFVADRRSNGSVLDREKVLNDLGAKFEVYVELRKNLDEGKIVWRIIGFALGN